MIYFNGEYWTLVNDKRDDIINGNIYRKRYKPPKSLKTRYQVRYNKKLTSNQKVYLDENGNMKITYYKKDPKQKSNTKLGFTHRIQYGIRKISSIYLQLQKMNHDKYVDIARNIKKLTKLKISVDIDYIQMIEDNDLKTNEENILGKVFDLSLKLFDVMKYYPDMSTKRVNYHELMLSSASFLAKGSFFFI